MTHEERQELLTYLEKVEEAQKKLDEKTKNSAIYKDYNIKLFGLIKVGIICFMVFLTCATLILGSTIYLVASEYFDFEQNITRTVTTETDDITGGGNSIILNRSDGANVNAR